MLKRKMPSHKLWADHTASVDTQETMRDLAQDLALPEGVSLVSLMHQERPKDITMAAGFTLLPNLLGEQVGMMGVRRRRGESNVIAVDEASVIKHAEAAQETQSGFVRRGKTLSVAKVVHISKNTKTSENVVNQEEVYLEASLKHERPSGATRQQMLDWMNKHFNEKERYFIEKPFSLHHKYGYGLTVKRALSDADLSKLWHNGNIADMPPISSSNKENKPSVAQKAAIIGAVKKAITKGGIKELSRLQRLLGNSDKLKVEVKHDVMETIEKRFLKDSIKFARPMNDLTSNGELVKRINAAKNYYASLEIAEGDIREDFLASDLDSVAVDDKIKAIREKRVKTPDYLNFKGMSQRHCDALLSRLSTADNEALAQLTKTDPSGKMRLGFIKPPGIFTPIF